KTLKKLEKTRQIIEQEYFYMEKEMKDLGIHSSCLKKPDIFIQNNETLTTDRKDCETEETFREENTDQNEKEDVKKEETNLFDEDFEFLRSASKRRSSLNIPKTKYNIETKRKFSLDSSGLAFKNNLNITHTPRSEIPKLQEEKNDDQFNSNSFFEELKLNLENKSTYSGLFPKSEFDYYQKQSARTQFSIKSALTNQSNFSNLSALTSNSLRKSGLFGKSSSRLPKIKKKHSEDEQKRKVRFGQVELNQLDIPIMYRHSNVAMEKFKLDPHFYLPNGNLKRKFSLPKLDEALEAIKNCRYIRKNSLEQEECIDVKNIFKDICSSGIYSRNLDDSSYLNEDDY
ncbi:unnamed protein product, partial [Brachionus calyciflorus]